MKRKGRLLLLILVFSLVISALLAVFSFADTSDKKQILHNNDLTGLTEGYDSVNSTSGAPSRADFELAGKKWLKFTESHTNDGNKYLKAKYRTGGYYNSSSAVISYDGINVEHGNTYLGVEVLGYGISSTIKRLNHYETITVDFDFMSETGIYHNNMSLNPQIRSFNASGSLASNATFNNGVSTLIKQKSDSKWYIGNVALNQGKYAWNHLSYVITVIYDDINGYENSTYEVKVNGQTAISGKLFSSVSKDASRYYNNDLSNVFLEEIRISFASPVSGAASLVESNLYKINSEADVCFCIDNVMVNGYENGYGKAPDVIYDENYQLPLSQSCAAIDGIYYTSVDEAVAAMQSASETIELFAHFSESLYVDNRLTLITNGYTIPYTMSDNFRAIYKGNGVIQFFDNYKVYWHIGDEVIETQCDENEIPTPPALPKQIEYDGLLYNTLGGWSDCERSQTPISFTALQSDMHFYPTVERDAVFYTVEYADGTKKTVTSANAILPNGADIIAEIEDSSNSFISIKLNNNITVNEDATIPAGKTVYIDVAGYNYTYTWNSRHRYTETGSVAEYDGYDSPGKRACFYMSSNSNLYLYSSNAGGKFFNSLYNYGHYEEFTDGETSKVVNDKPAVKGQAIVFCSTAVKNSNLYVGEVSYDGNTYDGDNLSTYAACLIYYSSDSTNKVRVNGGEYCKSVGDNSALFVATGSTDIDIKNADLIAYLGYLFRGNTASSAVKINIDNCVLYSKSNEFIIYWNNTAEMTISDSYIFTNLGIAGGTGKVTFKDGVRVGSNYTVSSSVVLDSVAPVKSTSSLNWKFNYNIFTYIHDSQTPKNSVYDKTTSESIISDNVFSYFATEYRSVENCDKIIWKYGELVVEEYWAKGLVPSCPFEIPEATDTYYFDAGKILLTTGGKTTTYEYVQKANISVLMNVSLYSDFVYNIYIPTSYPGTVTSVKLDGSLCNLSETEYLNGTEYYVIRKEIPASSGAEEYTLALSAIGYNSDEFTQNYVISIPRYAAAVLDGGYNDSAKALMRKVLSYVKSACEYFGTSYGSIGQTDEIIPVSGTPLGSVPDSVLEVFSGAQLSLGAVPKFRFNVSSSATFNSATFTYYVNGVKKSVTVYSDDLTTDEKGNKYYEIGLKAKDMQSDITVTVNGEAFAYNLANYIYNTNNNPVLSSNEKLTNLLYSLWAYSQASLEYVDEAPIVGIQINGNSVEEYKIVAGTVEEQNAAAIFRNQVYLKTGILLDVVTEYDGKSIVFKISDSSQNDFFASLDGDNLVMQCLYKSFFEDAVISFCDDYVKKINGIFNITESFAVGYSTSYVSYYDFGAVGDGVADDYKAMNLAHAVANAKNYTVKVNEGIYNLGAHTTSITIKTDVDWTGATIISDDSKIAPKSPESNAPIFTISPQYSSFTLNSSNELVKQINAAGGINADEAMDNFFGYAPGFKAMLIVTNANHKVYIRYGGNENAGEYQREVIVIDENGNIDESTPFLLDYSAITSIGVYRIDDDPITIQGGKFITVANQAPSAYTYYARNFDIRRSNTTIKGMEHVIEGELDHGAPYSGFLGAANLNNLLVEDCIFQGHRYYTNLDPSTGGATSMGTYELGGSFANNLYYKNCYQSNFFDKSGNLIGNRYWGVMGTNFCKNITYDNCTLSRLDAHAGVINANVINGSNVININLIGGGTARIEDSTVYNNSLLNLRSDYGSTWKGDIIIKNTHLVNTVSTATLISAVWYNHNFGYTTYLPMSIEIDNFSMEIGGTLNLFSNVTSTGDFDFTASTVQGVTNNNPYALTSSISLNGIASNVTVNISSDTWISSQYTKTTSSGKSVYTKKN